MGTVLDVISLFGTASMGDQVKVCPSMKSSQLKSFVEPSPVDEKILPTGRYDTIAIKSLSAKTDEVVPGSIISLSSKDECRSIEYADVIIDFNGRAPMIRKGAEYVMHVHNAAYSITLETIKETLDKRTLKVTNSYDDSHGGASTVRGDAVINGIIKLGEPATFEQSNEYPSLGRFILTKDGQIVGFGKTKSITYAYKD